MKNTIFILLMSIFSLTACKQHQQVESSVLVYKSEKCGEVFPKYLVIRNQPQVFELLVPQLWSSVIGTWTFSNDTLYTLPLYEYNLENGKLLMKEIDNNLNVLTIPHKYLLKNDRTIVDITDYRIILDSIFLFDQAKEMFFRLK